MSIQPIPDPPPGPPRSRGRAALRLVAFAAVGASAAAMLTVIDVGRADAVPAPAAHHLPWRRTAIDAAGVPRTGERAIVLYVAAACPHCAGVSRYVDSVARHQGRRLFVLSADTDSAMRRWVEAAGITATVVRDSAQAMRRALDVRFVPTLVTWDTAGSAHRVVGADRRPVRRALEASR